MLVYLGWIAAAFLAGVMLMLLLQHRAPSLQRRVARLEVFAGRSYAEILRVMDAPQTEARQADGRIVRTWRNDHYSISLLFDARDMCMGVQNEGKS